MRKIRQRAKDEKLSKLMEQGGALAKASFSY